MMLYYLLVIGGLYSGLRNKEDSHPFLHVRALVSVKNGIVQPDL